MMMNITAGPNNIILQTRYVLVVAKHNNTTRRKKEWLFKVDHARAGVW